MYTFLSAFYGLQPSEVQPEATGWIGSTAALVLVPRLMLSLSLSLSFFLFFTRSLVLYLSP